MVSSTFTAAVVSVLIRDLDHVSSAVWHHSGIVLATCSGSRDGRPFEIPSYEGNESSVEDETRPFDNRLKIWTV